jgi:hypothetical protein
MELNIRKIVEDKLPIKYILGIQKELDGFPNAFDIVHIYIVENINRPNRPQYGFSKASLLKYHANGKIENVEKGIEQAINLGLIEQTKFEEGKEAYSIKINPFQ